MNLSLNMMTEAMITFTMLLIWRSLKEKNITEKEII